MTALTFPDFRSSKDYRGYANRWRQKPNTDIDDLCLQGRAKVQRLDRVAYSNVSVHTHHGQGEYAREHVVVVNGNDYLAQYIPKWPGIH